MIQEFFRQIFHNVSGFYLENQLVIGTILWWVVLLIVLIFLARVLEQIFLFYKQKIYENRIEWVLLELKIPREVGRTPRAMEQFFKSLHGLRNAPADPLEKYIDGEITLWWSLEIVSFGGEVHFYIRAPKKHQKMTAAALFAQYPTAEVIEVKEDYIDQFPATTKEIYEGGQHIFGSEFRLRKKDLYPITTYEFFEQDKEEMALDPISALIEVFANIRKEEVIWFQIIIRPASDDWKKQGEKFLDKLIGRKVDESKKGGLTEFLRNLVWAPAEHPVWGDEKLQRKEEKFSIISHLTPGEQEVIKAIESNISKPGFESLVRFVYFAPPSVFSTNFARRGIKGALNQYASINLNAFDTNYFTETRSRWIYYPHIFVVPRVEARKQRLLYNYRNRLLPEDLGVGRVITSYLLNFNNTSKPYILSSTELATIYHIPAEEVLTAPHIKRLESKRMGPPAGLPIFGQIDEE